MQLQYATDQFEFQGLGSRRVVAQFDGGTLTSHAGALLVRDLDGRTGIMDGFAECFTDHRHSSYCDHGVRHDVGPAACTGSVLGTKISTTTSSFAMIHCSPHCVARRM